MSIFDIALDHERQRATARIRYGAFHVDTTPPTFVAHGLEGVRIIRLATARAAAAPETTEIVYLDELDDAAGSVPQELTFDFEQIDLLLT